MNPLEKSLLFIMLVLDLWLMLALGILFIPVAGDTTLPPDVLAIAIPAIVVFWAIILLVVHETFFQRRKW
ncbi:MAG: hypothetical protein QXL94_00455 [Candidatus Parvarchaeum sp.]